MTELGPRLFCNYPPLFQPLLVTVPSALVRSVLTWAWVREGDTHEQRAVRNLVSCAAELRLLDETGESEGRKEHGGRATWSVFARGQLADASQSDKLLALDEAITRLESTDPPKAQLVKLRYFAGLTNKDAAAALGISTSTADRYWTYARAFKAYGPA